MFEALLAGLPWWLLAAIALGLVAVSIVAGTKIPGWVSTLLAAARAGAFAALLPRLPRPGPPKPQPLDPERDPALPPAVAVDSEGRAVGSGPPPETESGSGG